MDDNDCGFSYSLFDPSGGLASQLAVDRTFDAFSNARQVSREHVLTAQLEHLSRRYNQLLAYAQGLERDLEQRHQQLADTQKDLAVIKAELDYQTFAGQF